MGNSKGMETISDEDIIAAVEYVVDTYGFDVQDDRDANLVEDVAIAVVRHLTAMSKI